LADSLPTQNASVSCRNACRRGYCRRAGEDVLVDARGARWIIRVVALG